MTVIHVEFPRQTGARIVPIRTFPADDSGICAAFDQRHRLRWYRIGTDYEATAKRYHYAASDGPQFARAYAAGIAARAFGVCLMECVE